MLRMRSVASLSASRAGEYRNCVRNELHQELSAAWRGAVHIGYHMCHFAGRRRHEGVSVIASIWLPPAHACVHHLPQNSLWLHASIRFHAGTVLHTAHTLKLLLAASNRKRSKLTSCRHSISPYHIVQPEYTA